MIKPDPVKVQEIKLMKTPQSSDEVCRFLGLLNYLPRFLPNVSAESEPLRRLANATPSEFTWQEDQQLAFEKLKKT